MKIYKIKSLNCLLKENRKNLIEQVNKTLKTENKKSKEELKKICKILNNRYKMKPRKLSDRIYSIEVNPGSFSILKCYSDYEFYCKYILYVKQILKYRKSVEEFNGKVSCLH